MFAPNIRRAAPLAVLLPLLLAGRGERAFSGHELKERSPHAAEAAALRSDPEGWRGLYARAGLWILVAPSSDAWSRLVTPGLNQALGRGGSRQDFERFARGLDRSIDVAGPDLQGALVRVDLPDGRGRAYAAIQLPLLLQRGGDPGLLNRRRPNAGLFLSGADVKPRGDDDIHGLYLPSRPRELARGLPPSVEARELPGRGRGDLAIFGGRGGGGEEGEDLRQELRRWVGRDTLNSRAMRTFPKDGSLTDALKTTRIDLRQPERGEGWYPTLASDPSGWSWTEAPQRLPTRYLAQVAPVVVDAGRSRQEVVVGVVAFYTRLFLTPPEAAAASGAGADFFEAAHRGELPFFRIGDDVLFYRGHVDRWERGRERRAEGKARTYKDGLRAAESLAERARQRSIDRALRRPLPLRMTAIPEDEQRELVDRRRTSRGRVYLADLVEWLSHQGGGLPDGPAATWVLGEEGAVAELRAAFRADSALASREPPPRRSGELARAPRPGWMDDGDAAPAEAPARGAPPREASSREAPSRGASRPREAPSEEAPSREASEPRAGESEEEVAGDETIDLDALPEEAEAAPEEALEVDDFFASGACHAGGSQTAVLDLLYLGPQEGEIGALTVEWDLFVDERIVANDVVDVHRGAGSLELELELSCPDVVGSGRLEVLVRDVARGLVAESSTPLRIKSSSGRTWAKLVMPSPKRCLDGGPSLDSDSDYGMAESQGLSADQIGAAVRAFQEQTLRCHEGGPQTGQVTLDFTVGCDGVVRGVEVAQDDTGDPTGDFARCVAQTMAYAPFPAHARDEVFFTMPLRFE